MRNKLKTLFFFILVILLTSCDPPHNIYFINATDSEIKVKINKNIKVENYDLEEISKTDSIVFNIKSNDTAGIYFGIGTWSDREIDKLVNSINCLEIETKDMKTIHKSKKSITKLFKENRKGGFFKTSIEIKVK